MFFPVESALNPNKMNTIDELQMPLHTITQPDGIDGSNTTKDKTPCTYPIILRKELLYLNELKKQKDIQKAQETLKKLVTSIMESVTRDAKDGSTRYEFWEHVYNYKIKDPIHMEELYNALKNVFVDCKVTLNEKIQTFEPPSEVKYTYKYIVIDWS